MRVVPPATAEGETRVVEERSRIAISFALDGASAVPAHTEQNVTLSTPRFLPRTPRRLPEMLAASTHGAATPRRHLHRRPVTPVALRLRWVGPGSAEEGSAGTTLIEATAGNTGVADVVDPP